MSAYMVEDNTINKVLAHFANANEHDYMVRFMRKHGYDVSNKEGLARLGVRMFALNARAINARYGHDQAQEFRSLDYEFHSVMPPTKIQVLKSLRCWLYQCSEGNVPETRLYTLINEISYMLALQIVDSLPAYDLANWG